MKLIFISSPYRGDTEGNTLKARRYCLFAYQSGVVPLAPHLHNTQFLDEDIPEERTEGLKLGLELLKKCDEVWMFGERFSEGMLAELDTAINLKKPVRYFNDKCEKIGGIYPRRKNSNE